MYYNNELYHWGILGQKWGVRRYQNPDGTLTAAGRERYRASDAQVQRAKDIIKENRWKEDVSEKVFDTVGADKEKLKPVREELTKAIQEQKQITNEVDELFSGLEDHKTFDNYAATAEIANDMKYYDHDGYEGPTARDVASSIFMGVYEDGRQGQINPWSLYAYDKGLNEQVKDLSDRSDEVTLNKQKACGKVVDEALKEIGNKNIKQFSKYQTTGEAVVDSMFNQMEDINSSWEEIHGPYTVRDAEYSLHFDAKDKEYVTRAKKIMSNIGKIDENAWYYFDEAIDSLGLSDVPAEKLTKADWQRINAETRKFRKKA